MPPSRRALAALLMLAAAPALAHHGWRWTADQTLELTGVIESARLGNPHGVLSVRAEDTLWTVEVGQPWRNARAGLSDAALRTGVELVIAGKPSADIAQRLLKAEKIWIGGVLHNLYPDRG